MMNYDVVVIGGGPSGMAAALGACEKGAKTLILETEPRLGGILNQCIHNGFGLHIFKEELTGPEYAARFTAKLKETDADVFLNTLVLSVTPDRVITAASKEHGMLEIKAGAIVFSTGCRERPRGAIGIPGTRPAGVITAGAAQKYVNIMGYMPGRECVILGSGDIGLIMARRMTLEGARVKAVVELMPFSSGLARNIKQCLDDFDIPLLLSHTVTQIHGRDRVSAVTVAAVDEKLRPIAGSEQTIECDTLLLSVGLIPTTDLAIAAGAELAGAQIKVDQNFSTTQEGIFICGNTLHVHDLVDYVTAESTVAGGAAADYALCGRREKTPCYEIGHNADIGYTVPQILTGDFAEKPVELRFRTRRVMKKCTITVSCGGEELARIKRPVMAPGEMQTLHMDEKLLAKITGDITIAAED